MNVSMAVSISGSKLSGDHPQLAGELESILQQAQVLGVTVGVQRIALICNQYDRLSPDIVYRWIDLSSFQREVEEAAARNFWVGRLYIVRNALILLLLLFTAVALFFVANAYQQDLSIHPGDLTQPFLKLWQEGFHGTTPFTFSVIILVDVLLLTLYFLLTILGPTLENRAKRISALLTRRLQYVADELMGIVGSSSTLSENDVNKMSNALGRMFDRAMLKSNQVAQEARDFIAKSKDHVDKVVGKFDTDLATFNTDVQLLTTKLDDLGTNLQNYDQKLKDLTDASTQLATSSGSLTKSADVMALSAGKSAQANQGISTQLSTLNTTQQQIVATQQEVAHTIEATQKDAVKAISTTQQQVVKDLGATQQQIVKEIADKMEEVAKNTTLVAKELGQITQADLQAMTNKVAAAADQVTRVANGLSQIDQQLLATTQAVASSLSQVDQQLQVTTDALKQADQALATVSTNFRKQSTKRWWQFWKDIVPSPSTLEHAGSEQSQVIPRQDLIEQDKINALSLFAITRTALEDDDKAFVGKTYSAQAGIAQNKLEHFQGESFDLYVRNIDEYNGGKKLDRSIR